jgi:hypothetical protein
MATFTCFPPTSNALDLPPSSTQLKCKKPDGFFTCVQWFFFYPNCRNVNLNCNSTAGAWVPAVTICNQQLFLGLPQE